MNRRHFLATTTAALASVCVSPAGDSMIAVSAPILGTFTETYQWRHFEYDHTIGLQYDGPEGSYWLGFELTSVTRSESEDKYIPFLQPILRAELERCILECRKTGELA